MSSESLEDLEKDIDILKKNGDEVFKILTGMFVFFMQCGFAFLEAGSVRSKNTVNILIKNQLDLFIGSLTFWAFGYSFAYGTPGNSFMGYYNFFSTNVNLFSSNDTTNDSNSGTYTMSNSYFANWFFQYVFAATSATIVSGAMAERAGFVCYIIYSFIITGFVYPIIAHWVWSDDGWLKGGGYEGVFMQDFSGSAVVHLNGGIAALVGSSILGPRLDRFTKDGNINSIPGHSVPLVALGSFILFVGFLAFNGGSVKRVSEENESALVALCIMNTILAGSTGGIMAMVSHRIYSAYKGKGGYWSLLTTINGALTGMVSSCAGCNDIEPWSAVLIGTMAGFMFTFGKLLVLQLKIDDPLDSITVHMGGGILGTLAAPVFAIKGQMLDNQPVGGIIYSGHWKAFAALGWSILGCCCIVMWTGLCSFALFYTLYLLDMIRVAENTEIEGMDNLKHGGKAYPEQYQTTGFNHESPNVKEQTEPQERFTVSEDKQSSSNSIRNNQFSGISFVEETACPAKS